MVASEVVGGVFSAGFKFSDAEALERSFRAVATATKDIEVPVRVQAVLALVEMIQKDDAGSSTSLFLVLYVILTFRSVVRKAIAPEIGVVVQDLLKLSDETDLEALNAGLEAIVEAFQEELLPVAVQLTATLVCGFLKALLLSLFLSAILTCVSRERVLLGVLRIRSLSERMTKKTIRPTLLWGLAKQSIP